MKRSLVLFLYLMGGWLLLSGYFRFDLVSYGALSCIGVVLLVARLGVLDTESLPTHLGLAPLLYLPWLLKEIVVSNFVVAKIILDPKLPIQPHLVQISTSARSDVVRVIYANSITLTPGTVTLDIRDGRLLVHALTDASADALVSGEMDRRVARLEGPAK